MPSEVTVLIADAERIPGVRADSPIEGAVLYFSSSNLASAFESIRAHDPKIVAIESHFAESPEGRAFLDRMRTVASSGSEIRLLGRANGGWATTPMTSEPAASVAPTAPEDSPASLNTRRAPRFQVVTPAPAVIDGTVTNLIDMSVLGAQVLFEPMLRPKQRIRVTIVEDDAVLRFAARVAWSIYEKSPTSPNPHYRAGMQFDDATQQALDEFLKRHCSQAALKQR